MTYLNKISLHILQYGEQSLVAGENRKMAVNKSEWSQLFVVSNRKKPPDRFLARTMMMVMNSEDLGEIDHREFKIHCPKTPELVKAPESKIKV